MYVKHNLKLLSRERNVTQKYYAESKSNEPSTTDDKSDSDDTHSSTTESSTESLTGSEDEDDDYLYATFIKPGQTRTCNASCM